VSQQVIELRLNVGLGSDAEAWELDEATSQLRQELASLNVNSVSRPAGGKAPPGTRGVEIPELATLLVTLGPDVIAGVASTIAAWVGRAGGRRIKLDLGDDSIEATGVSKEDQRRLIEAFLARQSAPAHEHGS
jgi:hypothetical protein